MSVRMSEPAMPPPNAAGVMVMVPVLPLVTTGVAASPPVPAGEVMVTVLPLEVALKPAIWQAPAVQALMPFLMLVAMVLELVVAAVVAVRICLAPAPRSTVMPLTEVELLPLNEMVAVAGDG